MVVSRLDKFCTAGPVELIQMHSKTFPVTFLTITTNSTKFGGYDTPHSGLATSLLNVVVLSPCRPSWINFLSLTSQAARNGHCLYGNRQKSRDDRLVDAMVITEAITWIFYRSHWAKLGKKLDWESLWRHLTYQVFEQDGGRWNGCFSTHSMNFF